MTRRLPAAAGVLVLALGGCFGGDPEPVGQPLAPASSSLSVEGAPPVRIGVIVSTRGPGSTPAPLAAGARLAEYRLDGLDADGDAVDLVVRDDLSNPDSAVDAVEDLADEGVAGIVYVSNGAHLTEALARAGELDLPVLLPYEAEAEHLDGAPTAFLTGPVDVAMAEAVSDYLGTIDASTVLAVADPEHLPSGLERLDLVTVDFSSGELAEPALSAAVAEHSPDAFVVWADPVGAAQAVGALQRLDRTEPIVLSTDALRPSFAAALDVLEQADGRAALDGDVVAVGPAVTDFDRSPAVDGFLRALRIAALDAEVQGLFGDPGISAGLTDAADATADPAGPVAIDTGAHDAVLLLVAAAREAGSTEGADVLDALEDLDTTAVAGLAGPPPSFGQATTLGVDDLLVVRSEPGTSPARTGLPGRPLLHWFPAVPPAAEDDEGGS